MRSPLSVQHWSGGTFVIRAVLGGALLLVAGCGDDVQSPEPAGSSVIRGSVKESDGPGVSGIQVSLSGAVSRSAATSSSGAYEFTALPAGGYEVSIELPSRYSLAEGQSGTRSVTVDEGESVTVDFEVVADGSAGTVVDVELVGLSFSPSNVQISVGQTVRWINRSSDLHTVTPEGHNAWASRSLNQQGQAFEHTFNSPGTYDYFGEPHRAAGMTGRVVVQ